jgi:hypothetical protein
MKKKNNKKQLTKEKLELEKVSVQEFDSIMKKILSAPPQIKKKKENKV